MILKTLSKVIITVKNLASAEKDTLLIRLEIKFLAIKKKFWINKEKKMNN